MIPPSSVQAGAGRRTSFLSSGARRRRARCVAHLALSTLICLTLGHAQQVENGLLRVGGFRCASLKSLGNDNGLDLYRTGYWNYTGFRMEVWRRLGVPFWYRKGTGVVRVAGEGWRPELGDDISSAEAGGKAMEEIVGSPVSPQEPTIDPHDEEGRGALNAIDGDKSTSWQPPDDAQHGKLIVTFSALAQVNQIRFLSDNGPRSTPRDYSVGLILANGSTREIASIAGEYSIGSTWRRFPVSGIEAKGIYIDVRSSGDGKHSPTVTEFEAKGEFVADPKLASYPPQVVIPMGGYAGQELHFVGNVGSGFPVTADLETTVGDYVIHYVNGQSEDVGLIAGKNVADLHYGHFVPEAEFAYGLKPHDPRPGEAAYHLDRQLPVEANDQFMIFSHRLEHANCRLHQWNFVVRARRPV